MFTQEQGFGILDTDISNEIAEILQGNCSEGKFWKYYGIFQSIGNVDSVDQSTLMGAFNFVVRYLKEKQSTNLNLGNHASCVDSKYRSFNIRCSGGIATFTYEVQQGENLMEIANDVENMFKEIVKR